MKFIGIDQTKLEPIIERDQEYLKKRKIFIILFFLAILLTYALVKVMQRSVSHETYFTMVMLGAIFSLTAAFFLGLYDYFCYFKTYQELRRNKKRLGKKVSLEIVNNTIYYIDNNRTLSIKDINNVLMLENKDIKVSNEQKLLLIDGYLNGADNVFEILQFMTKLTAAKSYQNTAFKQLLKLSDDHSLINSEIKQMSFLLPINYTLNYFKDNEDCCTLSCGLTYQYETITINQNKYLCIYSNYQEYHHDQYSNQLIMTYNELKNLINDSNFALFNNVNALKGIVVNRNSDNLIFQMQH